MHIYKISLISAQIDARLRDTAGLSEHELGLLSAKLDSWLNELPEPLSLNVTSHETFIPDIMPLLLMHMVYITARVTFYERVVRLNLDPHETTSGRSVAKQVLSLPEDVCDIYAVFAQQVARIVGLFNENQCIIKNCWIAMYGTTSLTIAEG